MAASLPYYAPAWYPDNRLCKACGRDAVYYSITGVDERGFPDMRYACRACGHAYEFVGWSSAKQAELRKGLKSTTVP